ncbi:hypothetical protein KHS38_13045 [Mucilaginibacter sp. Bleaf8]|uniref:hypothetical protein n=1 Tax=Mucilaginibacter sp. Bleaf8 TaxID=2834430 RepID=UPI001BD10B63|nr:hypothetical protein [Mucilaginibacter sp. Bleaf8]MBS7565333.1 hypothetical protein [Mucilaginibacter sp. Bleaf8]
MAAMSNKQELYLSYLLKTIGFQSNDDIREYIKLLINHYVRRDYHLSGKPFWNYSDCISIVKQEVDIKRFKSINEKKLTNALTASDLSAFGFCPVSYVLNRSFEIEHPTNQNELELGTEFHGRLITAKRKYVRDTDNEDLSSVETYNKRILTVISSSTLIYAGHKEKKPFYNLQENFWGDPDYIFMDKTGTRFVVEEKFSYKHDPARLSEDEKSYDRYHQNDRDHEADKKRMDWKYKKVHFYENHILQIYSYIRNHPDGVRYGYLIYWYYDFDESGPYIHKYDVKDILPTDSYEQKYQEVKSGIEALSETKACRIEALAINHKKCVRCSVNKYCGHKSKRYNDLTFPYHRGFLRLYLADFPAELVSRS